MTKKGPLSKAEKFYIENHVDVGVKELCKDLDRAQTAVKKFISTLPKNNTVTTKSEGKGRVFDQFARNEEGGATVMTPAAAEMADEMRKKPTQTPRAGRCTTTVK
jgi:predicted ArsR family transcriptional regulator